MTPGTGEVSVTFPIGFGVLIAAVLGSIIGSFLNACIHRLPRNLSLASPRRSFCPSCERMIPWHENLPVLSWLLLKGRCSGCGNPISIRYLVVEILTAVLFVAAFLSYGFPAALPYWVMLSILTAATFIDIEHFIIPDQLTWGGVVTGVFLAILFPATLHAQSIWSGLLHSLGGAILGFGLLWLVVEGGKLAFGRKTIRFTEPGPFVWKRDGDRADLFLGEDRLTWEETFSRESDQLRLDVASVVVDGEARKTDRLVFQYDKVRLEGGETLELDALNTIEGMVSRLSIPREAMGFGDVKFMAAIGAFLGWQAVLFTLFAASITGCIAAIAGVLITRDRSGARVPFGPFLALGAAWWIFGGQGVFQWYFSIFRGQVG